MIAPTELTRLTSGSLTRARRTLIQTRAAFVAGVAGAARNFSFLVMKRRPVTCAVSCPLVNGASFLAFTESHRQVLMSHSKSTLKRTRTFPADSVPEQPAHR